MHAASFARSLAKAASGAGVGARASLLVVGEDAMLVGDAGCGRGDT